MYFSYVVYNLQTTTNQIGTIFSFLHNIRLSLETNCIRFKTLPLLRLTYDLYDFRMGSENRCNLAQMTFILDVGPFFTKHQLSFIIFLCACVFFCYHWRKLDQNSRLMAEKRENDDFINTNIWNMCNIRTDLHLVYFFFLQRKRLSANRELSLLLKSIEMANEEWLTCKSRTAAIDSARHSCNWFTRVSVLMGGC